MQLDTITRFPIKGLTGQPLDTTSLAVNGTIVDDRRFALIHTSSEVRIDDPQWANKKHFLNRARDEKLGELEAEYTDDGAHVTLRRKGRVVVKADLLTSVGRMVLEDFLNSFMPAGARGHPRLIDVGTGRHLSDSVESFVSLLNTESVQDVKRVARVSIDPRRFRSNLLISGAQPWAEQQWVGQRLQIGSVVFEGVAPIPRCNAVNISPDTGLVDMNLPLTLMRGFRHDHCGLYLKVVEAGDLSTGDPVSLL